MKKKALVSALVVAMLLVFAVAVAAAVAPSDDVSVTEAAVSNGNTLSVSSDVNLNSGLCETVSTIYIKFPVPNGTTEGGLFLTVASNSYSEAFDLVVYQVNDDTWTEGTLDPTNPPALDRVLYTANIVPGSNDVADGQVIELSSTLMDTYVASQAGSDASFAIRIEGCSGLGASLSFVSEEGAAVLPFDGPDLTTPTAVAMTSVSAANQSSLSPILLGSILLLVLSVGILAVGALRRKETA